MGDLHTQNSDSGEKQEKAALSTRSDFESMNHQGMPDQSIARRLTGALRCISCQYNLHGLSIRGACPECGVPIRATILGIVDPHADELAPLSFPKLSAVGLITWSVGAFAAVFMVWVLRVAEFIRDAMGSSWTPIALSWVGLAGLMFSAIGASTLIRPHHKVTQKEALRSSIGIAAYIPLMYMFYQIYVHHESMTPSPVFQPGSDVIERSALRIGVFLVIAITIWALRPSAVGLAVRSVVIRTGRVDRQSMYAVLASLAVATLGDLIRLVGVSGVGSLREILSIVSVAIIALGSVLFTVGMFNICLDTFRLYPVLKNRGVGLSDIFETNSQLNYREGKADSIPKSS